MTENAYRKVTEDELEYERREARFKYQLQRNTELYVARNEGLSEGEAIGLKKGRSEGAAQEKREIAKSMKEKNCESVNSQRQLRLRLLEIEFRNQTQKHQAGMETKTPFLLFN